MRLGAAPHARTTASPVEDSPRRARTKRSPGRPRVRRIIESVRWGAVTDPGTHPFSHKEKTNSIIISRAATKFALTISKKVSPREAEPFTRLMLVIGLVLPNVPLMPKKRRRSSPRRIPPSASPARTRKIKRYGWIPDIPDQRDFLYAAPPAFLRALPPRVDLCKQCPPVYDQGQLGSCTSNAVGGAIEFDQMKEKLPQIFIPSRHARRLRPLRRRRGDEDRRRGRTRGAPAFG